MGMITESQFISYKLVLNKLAAMLPEYYDVLNDIQENLREKAKKC